MVDTVHLQPSFLTCQYSYDVREFYFSISQDKFFMETPPAWFHFFSYMELYYHGPLSIWAVWALWKGKHRQLSRFVGTPLTAPPLIL